MLEYDLDLELDLATETFRGTLILSGYSPEEAAELDAVELDIESVERAGVPVPFRTEPARGKLRLTLAAGPDRPLRIRYSGHAGVGVQTGLFVSRLRDHKALSTHMEPEGCRRVLPCLDRPDRKAVFRLRLTAAGDLSAISNSPGEVEALADGRRRWTFAPTPPMSSYLLYFGVGPFEEAVDDSGGPRIIVAGPPGSRARAGHTLSVARRTLTALGEYFELPYPLPKLHLVALSDFWVGMENWGAITGGEEHYLFDERTSPIALRFGEQTIVHEISHQWFGDLVTLESWEDLWLNEAFATFVTPRIQDRARLRADPWGEFVMFTSRGDPVDSLACAHPVKPDSVNAAEIMARADFITYFKGSRLVRMIESYVGEEAFRRGLSAYLKRHQFGNARSTDLWRALEESSGRGIVDVMRAWVERPGHPVIRVRSVGPDVELTQRRFGYAPDGASDPPWPIPLTIERAGERRSVLFDRERMVLPGHSAGPVRIDPGRAGFFRILLDPPLRPEAIEGLMSLPPLDRFGFVHDARAFLLSGEYSLDEYIRILLAVRPATDLVTVEEVGQSLHAIGAYLSDDPRFREAARSFCAAQLDRLGEVDRPDEPETNGAQRNWVAWMRVSVDDGFARDLAGRWDAVDDASPSMRQAIATAYARYGPAEAIDRLLACAVDPGSDIAGQACWAIEGLPDPTRVTRFLDATFEKARLSDLFVRVIWGAAKNPVGRPALWRWLPGHLRELERRAQGTYLLSYNLEHTIPLFGIGREAEVRAYFAAERFREASVGIEVGLETLEAVTRLRERIGSASRGR
jgi:tricorn protease interacting factor F2/3